MTGREVAIGLYTAGGVSLIAAIRVQGRRVNDELDWRSTLVCGTFWPIIVGMVAVYIAREVWQVRRSTKIVREMNRFRRHITWSVRR